MSAQPPGQLSIDFSQPERVPVTATNVLKATEVAEEMRVPVSTIHRWVREGRIPCKKIGRHRIFLRSQIDVWLLEQA